MQSRFRISAVVRQANAKPAHKAQHRSSAQTREHVLRVAQELFYWQGVRAVGVDRIAAEANIAPTTLYRLFPSKDDLVAAYVARADEHYRAWFAAAVKSGGGDPRQRILALFDALTEQIHPSQCRGCLFLMVLSEFPDTALLTHDHAVATKQWVRGQLRELTRELAANTKVQNPTALADQLALIMEGVYASVQALGTDGPASQARALVEAILPRTSANSSGSSQIARPRRDHDRDAGSRHKQ
jgi:AcrR family transcriptional regulator